MTDRELLELAAKAAGLEFSNRLADGECMARSIGSKANPHKWNPLTDDGDRYRLARKVKGNLYFSGRRGCFEIPSDSDEPPIVEHFDIGDERAEAYAIVRAAAEIGKAIP